MRVDSPLESRMKVQEKARLSMCCRLVQALQRRSRSGEPQPYQLLMSDFLHLTLAGEALSALRK